MTLQEAYQAYLKDPYGGGKEILGEAVLHYYTGLARGKDDDLIMDACLRFFEKLPQFRGDSNISTWAYRLFENRKIDMVRDEIEAIDDVEIDLELKNPAIVPGVNDNEIRQKEKIDAQRQVASILTRQDLTDDDRLLIRLKLDIEDQVYDKGWNEALGDEYIAEKLGISVNAVRLRWQKLKKKLQKPQ